MTTRRARHIGINGLFLDHSRTGTGVYTREVLSRLTRSAGDDRYTVFGHPEWADILSRGGGLSFRPMVSPMHRRSENAEKLLWEQVMLPYAAARCRVDLLFSPYFSLPLVPGVRTAVTIHDLIPLLLPEYAPSLPLQAYFRLVSTAARRADAVVTDSRYSARDIARVLHIPPRRIHVVYLGVDERYSRPVAPDEQRMVRERLGLPERYLLYFGGTDPRKNILQLLHAVRLLRDRGQHIAPLALMIGRAPEAMPAAWAPYDPFAEAARLGLDREVLFLERPTDDDKAALYAGALAFLWPSRYEGFGLPPLEAMACGTPVVCSDASSLPEVAGDATILLSPDDVEGWAEAMRRLDADEAPRRDLAERGRRQAAQFTWERTVEGLRGVFDAVLEER
jgi:glycosyltransferase involved in cell wall biosynthesis